MKKVFELDFHGRKLVVEAVRNSKKDLKIDLKKNNFILNFNKMKRVTSY